MPIPAVERLWFGDSDVDPIVGHRSDPVLGADLVFTFADGDATVALQGPLTTRRTYPHRPGARYVGVRFRPGFSAIFDGHALGEIRDGARVLERWGSERLTDLAERLDRLNAREQGRVLVDFVRRANLPAAPTSSTVAAALHHVARTEGRTSVTALARAVNTSVRQMQRLMSHHLGMTPKTLIRLTRIRTLQNRCVVENVGLAELALELGFTDQAHMSHEVRRVLFTTPSALVCESRKQRGQSIEVG